MSSNAAASWPSSSSESAWIGLEKSPRRDLPRRALEPLDARGQRARDEVAAERGEHERERAGDEDPAADQLDVGLHVGERVDEHRDAAHRPLALAADQRHRRDGLAADRRSARVEVTVRSPSIAGDGDRLDVGLRDRAGLGVRRSGRAAASWPG